MPESLYQFIFGNEFWYVRTLIIYMFPGIIVISVSNLFEQYFSGKGELKIIRNKSLIGLVTTVILLPLLIKKYHLTGVCITLDVSYILSSFYIWLRFREEGKTADYKKST
jgi:O-antigen/teichoic acid export membrane protein